MNDIFFAAYDENGIPGGSGRYCAFAKFFHELKNKKKEKKKKCEKLVNSDCLRDCESSPGCEIPSAPRQTPEFFVLRVASQKTKKIL